MIYTVTVQLDMVRAGVFAVVFAAIVSLPTLALEVGQSVPANTLEDDAVSPVVEPVLPGSVVFQEDLQDLVPLTTRAHPPSYLYSYAVPYHTCYGVATHHIIPHHYTPRLSLVPPAHHHSTHTA